MPSSPACTTISSPPPPGLEQCGWRPDALTCRDTSTTGCLSAKKVALANAFLDGPHDPLTGERFFPGLPLGTEVGWGAYLAPFSGPAGEPPLMGHLRMVFGPDIDWRRFDWHADAQTFIRVAAPFLDANSRDISAFANRGGKLMLYAGWADTTGSTIDTVNYYREATRGKHPSGAADPRLASAVRLFMMPGVGHCTGGAGPSAFDGLAALASWVRTNTAPESLVAHRAQVTEEKSASLERPLCAYPSVAIYKGRGDSGRSTSFRCAAPKR